LTASIGFPESVLANIASAKKKARQAVTKGMIHKNKAARHKSHLSKRIAALS
jgi:ribosomal protein S20